MIWSQLKQGVVGLLLAALYNPVWTAAIFTLTDFVLSLVCFIMLQFWRLPSWIVVLFATIVAAVGVV